MHSRSFQDTVLELNFVGAWNEDSIEQFVEFIPILGRTGGADNERCITRNSSDSETTGIYSASV